MNVIMQDRRVKNYITRKAVAIAKHNIAKHKNYRSQLMTCHAWLLPIGYLSVHRLKKKYPLSIPEFTILISAYLFKRKGLNGFKAKDLSSMLLPWQHTRIYRHLKKLSGKGYIRIEKNPYSGVQRYYLTRDGDTVVRSFNQHFRLEFGEAWERLGDFPPSFTNLLTL